MQPVRLVVEPGGYEEPHGKPNASPRPSILRKRDHDNSPVKGMIILNITLNVIKAIATYFIKNIIYVIGKDKNRKNIMLLIYKTLLMFS